MKLPKLPFNFRINFIAVIRFIKKIILRESPVPVRNFGLKRDVFDPRDILYKIRRPGLAPESTHLRNLMNFKPRYDQLSLGSCTANAFCYAYRKALQRNGQPDFDPSRLFAYFNARAEECKGEDSGASIRDVIKAGAKYGVCSEQKWPYNIGNFTVFPPQEAFMEALDHQAIRYERLPQKKESIMDAVNQGFPVVYGKMLYESFMTESVSRTGLVPVPNTCWESQVGGHAMWIIDYEKDCAVEMNSWGAKWGFNGACKVPWKYVLNPKTCFDFWAIYLTE